ncbi:MAG: AAA domain-containing protein [Candidatus Gastranaerophilales bacterium]|nr:AAA domain-containing protein [Candidatus Gastranaerophilales bacterium]
MQNKYKKSLIYLKGENQTENVQSINRIGDKYNVTFNNGKTFTYNASNVRIIESALNTPKSRDCFEYLRDIAEAIGLRAEVEAGKIVNILSHNYSKINFVHPNSMLTAFLSGKLSETKPEKQKLAYRKHFFNKKPQDNYSIITDTIYPFGFNASQKDAVEKALSNQLSIIEGPPGTGKTQTILNIIANAVMRGESVAIVSSNNSATKNVLDKLQKYNVDFIAAYLGNTNNKREFIDAQKSLPTMMGWSLTPETISALQQRLKILYIDLQEKLAKQNELSALKQELSAIEIESKYFLQYFESFYYIEPQAVQKFIIPEKALKMCLLCETYRDAQENKGIIGLIKHILEFLIFWDRRKSLIRKLLKNYSQDYLIAVFQKRFYDIKIAELTKRVSSLKDELKLFNFGAKMSEYSELSAKLFRSKLAGKYANKSRKIYVVDDLWQNSEEFIKDYPVILSTTYSLRSSLSKNVMYDYVIVDESSQVDLCTGALALSCAKKAVIVGDLKQLPNVVDSNAANKTDAIFAKYDLPEVYRYKKHSLLSSITTMFPEAPNTLLREHYRCHPKIIEFCNKKFYDKQLIILTETKAEYNPLILYKTVEGNHERNRVNQRQIDIIKEEIIPQQKLNTMDGSLGIVTPYRNQTNALQKAFAEMNVKADTVDKFQGQENAVIILSTVDNEITEFADNANRLNVAVSRAVNQLIVIVNNNDSLQDTNIGDLVRYIEYNNFEVIDSKVYSVFDYLYKNYAEHRRKFLAKHKQVSIYDSENLMNILLESILEDKKFNGLGVSVHVPLKMIVRDTSLMTQEEQRYAMNEMTHVDFLIFDTIDKSPRLVIEVDGVRFHTEGTRQSERDAMKNDILNKYGLPILRLRTDGNNERKQITELLDCLQGKKEFVGVVNIDIANDTT